MTIILAAGKGTRMKAAQPKVLFPLGGKPLLAYPISLARMVGSERIVVVVGYGGDKVRETFAHQGLFFVTQREQRGTGHAVLMAEAHLATFSGQVLILCGDVPLLRPTTVTKFIHHHQAVGAMATVMTTVLREPGAYGRVIRDGNGQVMKIVEAKDASPSELRVEEINTGIYCVDATFLRRALKGILNDNAQQEYYLTDIMSIAYSQGQNLRLRGKGIFRGHGHQHPRRTANSRTYPHE